MTDLSPLANWNILRDSVNGRTTFGAPGVRDPEYPCEEYDALGYNGQGECMSDGHYECTGCSHLSPAASRFEEYGREGRRDRLRLFWARKPWEPKP